MGGGTHSPAAQRLRAGRAVGALRRGKRILLSPLLHRLFAGSGDFDVLPGASIHNPSFPGVSVVALGSLLRRQRQQAGSRPALAGLLVGRLRLVRLREIPPGSGHAGGGRSLRLPDDVCGSDPRLLCLDRGPPQSRAVAGRGRGPAGTRCMATVRIRGFRNRSGGRAGGVL